MLLLVFWNPEIISTAPAATARVVAGVQNGPVREDSSKCVSSCSAAIGDQVLQIRKVAVHHACGGNCALVLAEGETIRIPS